MTALLLEVANQIVFETLKHARDIKAAPICDAVLDNRGIVIALQTEDGCALLRPDIAQEKPGGVSALVRALVACVVHLKNYRI